MGKRLIRIPNYHLLEKTAEFVSKQGNVVLKTGATYMGSFISYENNVLAMKDSGGKAHTFLQSEITELVLDFVS